MNYARTFLVKVRNKLLYYLLIPFSDVTYSKAVYRLRNGRKLNLKDPKLFSEKLQYLKLREKNSEYGQYVDKHEGREIVKRLIGGQVLNEQYFSTESPDEIDFNSLPDSFVLKLTHGSGFNVICQNKDELDWESTRKLLWRWLRTNYAKEKREWQYLNVKPRIVCERFLADESGSLRDFKFLCFHGVPRLIWVDIDRAGNHSRAFFDAGWNRVAVEFGRYSQYGGEVPRPDNLEEMLDYAAAMAVGFPFVRVDFYSISGRTIFGEVTLHPASGFGEFRPLEYGLEVGSWIDLNKTKFSEQR
ncbi:MAG: uncharacterized protein JWM59_5107 [Verrucomicrobiales bacterium]|nr:uncharacterized protein [Verrucomicrobiales bacterium]